MALDPTQIGATSEPHAVSYGWRDQALYALGIGARRDGELAYLYEGHPRGMKAFPTWAVIPAYAPVVALMAKAGVEMAKVVHGGQDVTVHRPLPVEGTLVTTAELTAVYDLKRFAQVILDTKGTVGGEAAVDTRWTIIVRGEGGFGGERPPPRPAPRIPSDREADFSVEEATSPEQALLYRLCGDENPLHADPEVAREAGFERPILHGLATYGFVLRAALAALAGGDAHRLRRLSAQFRKPVWPGDRIVTEGWKLDDGRVALRAVVKGRPDPVVSGAWVELD